MQCGLDALGLGMAHPNAFLYVWDDRFIYAAPSMGAHRTRRYSVTLLVSINGKPFWLHDAKGAAQKVQAVLIAPNVERSIEVTDSGYLSLNLDPDSLDYHALKHQLGEQPWLLIDYALFAAAIPRVHQMMAAQLSPAEAFVLSTDLVAAVTSYRPANLMIDLRVLHVARLLRSQLPLTPPVDALAASVGLSPSRLQHLFTEQMSIPMKSFVLWARMRRGLLLLQSSVPLTEVAHGLGFSDQAHFSRTFQGFFGVTPSSISRSSSVQVLLG